MRGKSSGYVADPRLAQSPLSVDEVDALLAGGVVKALARDSAGIGHLMGRVRATVAAATDLINSLRRDNERLRTSSRGGAPSTLNPLDALKYIPPEQVVLIFDGYMRQQIASMNQALGEATRTRAQLIADRDRLAAAASAVLSSPALPEAARAELAALLGALPPDPAPVREPMELPPPTGPAPGQAGLAGLYG